MRKVYALLVLLCILFFESNVEAQVTYYSKAVATDFTSAASWGTATDGSGAAPASVSNADNFVIQNGSAMNLNGGNASVRQLTINAGSLTVGSNTLTVAIIGAYNSSCAVASGGTLTVSGGSIVVNGSFAVTSGGKLNQTAGTISVDGNNGGSATGSVASGTSIVNFSPAANADIVLSGGTFIIVDPHYTTTTTFSCTIPTAGATAATGTHTFKFGDGISTDNGGSNGLVFYSWSGTGIFKFKNVIIETVTGGSNRFVSTSAGTFYNFVVTGDLTINSGGEFRSTNTSTTTGATYLAGNFTNNGTFTHGGGVVFGDAISASVTTLTVSASPNPQVVSGSGVFRNLTASPTANFTSLAINNTNPAGVTFSNANTLLSGSNTGTVSGTLTFTTGIANLNGGNFILGVSTTTLGTLTLTSGGFAADGTFTRWFAAATAGTTITASNIPSAGTGTYPFVVGVASRTFHLNRPSTTGATGGPLSVKYNHSAVINTIAPLVDGSYSVDRQTSANWVVSSPGAFAAGTGTFTYAVSGEGLYNIGTGNSRIMKASAFVGSHQNGTSLPHAQRSGIAATDFTGTFYLGFSSADIPIVSAGSGKWENPSTWVGGVVPTCGAAQIAAGHDVTVDGITGAASSGNLTIITTGGLIVSGGSLTIGCTLNNSTLTANGNLTVSGGTLNINGNLAVASTSTFTQSGGDIKVDGNAAGVTANSVATGTAIVRITGSATTVSLTGGTLTIVDPHAAAGTSDYALVAFMSTATNSGTGHTIVYGDGVSTDPGGSATNGFYTYMFAGTSYLILGNVTVNTGAGTNRHVNTTSNHGILGNLTINTGDYRIASVHYLAGNLVVNGGGTLTTTSTLNFASYAGATVAASANAQTISGAGVFRNLTASPTANFTSLTINNSHASGVTFSDANSLLNGSNTGTVSSTLTFTTGTLNTGANAFVMGISASTVGTITHSNGGFGDGSTLSRWIASAVSGTDMTGGSIPTISSNAGAFPFSVGSNRALYLRQSTAATTGGRVSVTYQSNGGGTTPVSIVDGAYTVDSRTKDSWTLSTSGITGTPAYKIGISAQSAYAALNGNSRVVMASAPANGAHQNGTAFPHAQRTGLSLADLMATYYIGISDADVSFQSVASGNWSNGATWNKGFVPGSSDAVIIVNTHTVTINAGAATAANITVNSGATLVVSGGTLDIVGSSGAGLTNSSGGTINVTGGTINLGPTDNSFANRLLTNSGTLSVSSGTLFIAGRLLVNTSSIFNQTGGNIIVDGNAGGVSANSVGSGIAIVDLNPSTLSSINLTGGTFTIVDPHANSTASKVLLVNGSTSGSLNVTANHTMRFGDGVSSDAGGNSSNGFRIDTWATTTGMPLGNVIVEGPVGTNRFVSGQYQQPILGNVTINNGGECRIGSIYINGNLTVNSGGIFTPTTGLFMTNSGFLDGSNVTFSASPNNQVISGAGTFRNAASGPTANFVALTVFNTDATGVTFGSGISSPTFSGAIAVTTGKLNATGITLQGSSAQTVALTAATSLINVSDFTLNNSTGATLSGSGFLNVSGVATITSGTLASAGRLTLKSTSSGTARIAPLVGTITGNVVVERYIPANGKRAWRLLGANVTAASAPTIRAAWQEAGAASSMGTHITQLGGAGTNGFDASSIATANHSIYAWDGTALTAPANTDVNKITDNGGAYFLFVRGDRNINLNNASASSNTTLRMTGVVNQGPVTAGVAGTSFSLIPNPYPSPVDYEAIIAGNVGLTGTYYIWDANLGAVGAYRVVVRTGAGTYEQTPYAGSTVSDNTARYIRSGQAFFIPNNMQVNFTEAMKTDMLPGINVYRPGTGTEQMMIELKVIETDGTATLYDGVRAKYNNSFSANVDINDAPKLNNFTENLAIVRSNKNLAVETRPLIDAADTIFLKLWNTGIKNYRFDINPANFSSTANLDAYLVDAYLNTTTPVSLSSNTAYDFSITSNTASAAGDRFMIVFRPATTLPANFTVVKAYQKNSGIQVEWNVGSEVDVVKYEVEKSTNGITFDKTGTVSATSSKAYNWFDASPNNGANFYRIKVINKDNTFNYSNVVNVKLGNINGDIAVYPNPVKGNVINLQFNNLEKGTYTVRLINSVGQQVYSSKIVHNGGSASQVMQLNTALSKGIYQLVVSNGDTKQTMQVIAE